ncbi:MAG: DUF2812 domain-containing protein [Oscillospiraceae bacterium]|nr:DUF2812 domain-containing protein [Oscillospiraceae bacterium]
MPERKTVYKWFWAWDFEKEERWLNEMSMQGWALVEVGFARFEFERCEPGEYIVRVEMRPADAEYEAFLEEIGAEKIDRMLQWVYYRRRAEEGPFDLFSDIDSRIAHMDRIGKMLLIGGMANLVIGVANLLASPNAAGGIVNLLVCTLLMYGLGRIHGKADALKQERDLHE